MPSLFHFQPQNHLCSPPAVAEILVLELYLYSEKTVSDYQTPGQVFSLLEAMARQDSRAEEAAWAAQLLHGLWSRTGVTNPDNIK